MVISNAIALFVIVITNLIPSMVATGIKSDPTKEEPSSKISPTSSKLSPTGNS